MSILVLASASASRARMLKSAGVEFVIDRASIDEEKFKDAGLSPESVAGRLAEAKALLIANHHPENALIIGADQVLVFEGELISKCRTMIEAKELLRRFSGKSHELVSSVAMVEHGQVAWRACGRARLSVRPLTEAFIDDYLANEGEGLLSGVGCYRMEGRGSQLFDRVEGDYFTILGLPLLPLLAALRERDMLAS